MKKTSALIFSAVLMIFGFPGYAQTWIPSLQTSFNFSQVQRLQAGPPGHIYALDGGQRLALIRIDSILKGNKLIPEAILVKTIPLAYWPGYEKEIRHFEFSSVSEDGRYIAFSLKSSLLIGRNDDGSPQQAVPKEEIFVLDAAEQRLEFRAMTGKKTTSGFFGQTLRYLDYSSGRVRVMGKDPEEANPRELFLPEEKPAKKVLNLNQHLSLSNAGFETSEELEVRDEINRLGIRIGAAFISVEKENKEQAKIALPAGSDLEIFRFREGHLLIIQPMDTFMLLNPRNGEITGIPKPEIRLHLRSTLINGNVLLTYSGGMFSLCSTKDGKVRRSLPVKPLPAMFSELPVLANSGPDRLIRWQKAGRQLRFNLRSRSFRFEKITGIDSSMLRFPVLNSKKFRIRTVRFAGSEEDTASAGASGIFMNGTRIGGFWKNAVDDFLKLDIHEKTGRAFLHYHQPMLFALNPQVKRIWTASDITSPLQAVKADEDGSTVYSISSDGIIEFRNSSNGRLFLSMAFDTSGKDWILWTPSGYFDSSEKGDQLLSWMPPSQENHFPGIVPVAAFAKDFRRPELVDAVMLCRDEKEALGRLKAASGIAVNQKKRLSSLPAGIQLEFPGDRFTFSGPELRLPYFLIPGRLPLKKIRVLLDGKVQPDYLPDGKEIITIKPPRQDCLLELIPVSAAGEGEKIVCRLRWQSGQ